MVTRVNIRNAGDRKILTFSHEGHRFFLSFNLILIDVVDSLEFSFLPRFCCPVRTKDSYEKELTKIRDTHLSKNNQLNTQT